MRWAKTTARGRTANTVDGLGCPPTSGKGIDPRTLIILVEANEPGIPDESIMHVAPDHVYAFVSECLNW